MEVYADVGARVDGPHLFKAHHGVFKAELYGLRVIDGPKARLGNRSVGDGDAPMGPREGELVVTVADAFHVAQLTQDLVVDKEC